MGKPAVGLFSSVFYARLTAVAAVVVKSSSLDRLDPTLSNSMRTGA
jgi:hypothetical protein